MKNTPKGKLAFPYAFLLMFVSASAFISIVILRYSIGALRALIKAYPHIIDSFWSIGRAQEFIIGSTICLALDILITAFCVWRLTKGKRKSLHWYVLFILIINVILFICGFLFIWYVGCSVHLLFDFEPSGSVAILPFPFNSIPIILTGSFLIFFIASRIRKACVHKLQS